MELTKPKVQFARHKGYLAPMGKEIDRTFIVNRNTKSADDVANTAVEKKYTALTLPVMRGAIESYHTALFDHIKAGDDVYVSEWLHLYAILNGKFDAQGKLRSDSTYTIRATALKDCQVDFDQFEYEMVNAPDSRIWVRSISTPGYDLDTGKIKRTGKFRALGYHMKYLDGDSVLLSFDGEDNEKVTISLTPTSSDFEMMEFDPVSTLETVAVGTTLTFTFRTKGGVADGEYWTCEKKATLVA